MEDNTKPKQLCMECHVDHYASDRKVTDRSFSTMCSAAWDKIMKTPFSGGREPGSKFRSHPTHPCLVGADSPVRHQDIRVPTSPLKEAVGSGVAHRPHVLWSSPGGDVPTKVATDWSLYVEFQTQGGRPRRVSPQDADDRSGRDTWVFWGLTCHPHVTVD